MRWKPYMLRDGEVWAKVDEAGQLVTDRDGRVDIVYKPTAGGKVYRAGARNLVPRDGETIELVAGERAPDRTPAADAIHVWTDGACTGNPGPAGLGVVIVDGEDRKELSEYLGQATNN